jgi:hypothetical protein
MIYLECNADEALIQACGVPKKKIKHVFSKGNVCRHLQKNKNAIGIVDEDPESAQPGYLEKLRLQSHEHNIKLFYEKKSGNVLIVLCPRLEEWILKAAKEAKIQAKDFGLPDHANGLHKVINSRLEHFTKLLNEIKGKSKMINALQVLLKR